VVLNNPLLKFLAKYVVVDPGDTLILFPVPIWVKPHPPVYQYTVPWAPLAVNVVVPPAQTVFNDALTEVGAAGGGVTHVNPRLKALVVLNPCTKI
jgi:hypothetical protein